ncbi:MAG: tetratricopeptide repeat protein [Alphaproteobacteria bacterium]|nr:tetratricopeptide repeat protein [Alphaproteobacteria bacterium]
MHDMNENSLLQEIEADLSRQHYEKLWKKYGPFVLAAAVLIVAVTAGFSGYKAYTIQTAQKTTLSYMEIFTQKKNSQDELIAALEKYGADNKGTIQSVFARFKAASAAAATQDQTKEAAIKMYDDLAADSSIDRVYRQLADLISVQLQLDTGDGAALETRLQPLMKDDCVWRFTSKEFAGYLALRLGDKEKAKAFFSELKGLKGVPASIAARSGDVLSWLNGGA